MEFIMKNLISLALCSLFLAQAACAAEQPRTLKKRLEIAAYPAIRWGIPAVGAGYAFKQKCHIISHLQENLKSKMIATDNEMLLKPLRDDLNKRYLIGAAFAIGSLGTFSMAVMSCVQAFQQVCI
jgi:hypothetical protein